MYAQDGTKMCILVLLKAHCADADSNMPDAAEHKCFKVCVEGWLSLRAAVAVGRGFDRRSDDAPD